MSSPTSETHHLDPPLHQAISEPSKQVQEPKKSSRSTLFPNGSSSEIDKALVNDTQRDQKQEHASINGDLQTTQKEGTREDGSNGGTLETSAEGSTSQPLSADSGLEEVDKRKPRLNPGGGFDPEVDKERKDEIYLDPTPKTPRQENSPSRGQSHPTQEPADEGSTSEIQSIMDQFEDGDDTGDNAGDDDGGDKSGTSLLKSPIEYPPRRSSLEPLRSSIQELDSSMNGESRPANSTANPNPHTGEAPNSDASNKIPPKRISSLPQSSHIYITDANAPPSPNSSRSVSKIPPPAPDPEPDLPFDFHRFLEQLRHRTADPVAKFLRSFLVEFGKKQWMVHEQVKIINDFLTFISNKMTYCEVWKGVSDAEFDNAREGMEKLVMNRLYSQTFSPAIPTPAPVQRSKIKKKTLEESLGPGRKGQHQEDIERDEVLGQKVRIYGWVQEEHLDIPPVGDSGRRFLVLAQQGKIAKVVLYIGRILTYL